MRLILCAPLLVCGLAACSNETEEPKPAADVEAEAAKLVTQTPGLYRTTIEVTDASLNDLAPEEADRAQEAGKTGKETSERCVTQEEAEQGVKEMMRALAQPDVQAQCDYTRFAVDGSDVDAKIICEGPFGTGGEVMINGLVEAERLDLVLDLKIDASMMGEMKLSTKIQSERIGPCAEGANGAG